MNRNLPSRRSQRTAKRLASGAHSNGKGAKGKYWSGKSTKPQAELYDSSYELQRFRMLDLNAGVLTWTKRHRIRLPYYDLKLKKIRLYVPDILVIMRNGTQQLEEVKGFVKDRLNFETKCAAARAYCHSRKMKFVVLYRDDLFIKKIVRKGKLREMKP